MERGRAAAARSGSKRGSRAGALPRAWKLGIMQRCTIARAVDFGAYLTIAKDAPKEEQILLPAKEIPEGVHAGDSLEVFCYRDSDDRPIATLRAPKILLHEVKLLAVREVTRVGAFLDWGLEKDLLLPFAEQRGEIAPGEEVLVALYLDKSDRLCATMNVYPYLEKKAAYAVGEQCTGRIYETSRNFGVFVAVDDRYSALIPRQEAKGRFIIGETMQFRVTALREDGRLVLSPRQAAYLQITPDAERILGEIRRRGGALPFDDKADPSEIEAVFSISKAAFKRAVGHLLKEGSVEKRDGKLIMVE